MHSKFINTNGIKIHAKIEGSGPLVILVHGCPESWFSWRKQISVIADAGYTVAAIDVRGYGQSDKPYPINEYSLKKLANDIVGIIDALNFETAILIGRDWGGPIVWHTALLHEDKISAVCGLSVPYFRRLNVTPIDLFKQIYKDRFFYQIYFQKEGVAEKELEPEIKKYLETTYFSIDYRGMSDMKNGVFSTTSDKSSESGYLEGAPTYDKYPDWITKDEINFLVIQFKNSGLRGPLNRYRNYDLDFKEMEHLSGKKIKQPCAFLAGSHDPVNFFILPNGYKDSNDLRVNIEPQYENLVDVVLLDNAGHWVQEEKPNEVNEFLLNFLSKLG
jgi:pimeloyl-ACP methyl ester carboxylesterase|tara:strand:+ start:1650 stop:2642 length:993 start_codon:yes stop_codon:yes gene_type:complete